MNKIWAIIRREFVERVRTKAFIIGTILGPIFFGAVAIIPGLLLSKQSLGQRIAIVDGAAGDIGGRIEQALAAARKGAGADAPAIYVPIRVPAAGRLQSVVDSLVERTALSRERGASLDGLLIVDDGSVTTGKLRYYGKNVGSIEDVRQLEGSLTPLMISERLRNVGVDPGVALKATTPVQLETRKVTEGKLTNQTGSSIFILAYGMGFVLYLSLILYGTQIMTSIVEEKSNRIVEVLVSSVSPFQMLLGKVIGVGMVSLVQIGVWASAAVILSNNQAKIMAFFGAASNGAAGAFSFLPLLGGKLMVVFLLFFALGFLLYSSAYAAIGSMCNTVQETQQVQAPVTMLTLVGFFSVFALMRDPSSSFARIGSLIPPLAPFIVPVRYSIAPIPIGELALAIATTIVGLLILVWLAARIYRVGILMYGKRASLRDIARWVRQS